jgi:hypothetical protein
VIKTVYNGIQVWLLDLQPDWDQQPVECEFSLVADAEAGLTNREGRRPFSATLRCKLSYSGLALEGKARELSGGLRQVKADPVVVPFWPAAVRWADRATRPIGSGLNIVFKEEFAQWEIYENVEPGWPAADDQVAPLLWGRLETKSPQWEGPEMAVFPVRLIEESQASYAVVPAAVAFANGPTPAGYGAAPKLFPFAVNFDSGIKANVDEVVLRTPIGFARQQMETFYAQTPARSQVSEHELITAIEAAQALEFFRQHGAGKSFWCPDFVSAVVLTADVGAADTVLHVKDTLAVITGDWIVFSTPDSVLGTARITAKTNNTVTIAVAVGVLMPAGTTLVSFLVLGKFGKRPLVTVQWKSLDNASVELALVEVPAEYAPAADETLGTTIGVLPTRCYLYEFSRTLDGVLFVDRFTSYESDLTFGGNTYHAKKIGNNEIVQGIFLDMDGVDIESDMFQGNPAGLMASLRMEAPLFCVIRQGEVNAGAAVNVAIVFKGEVTQASPKGSKITAKTVTAGSLFDRMVPCFTVQPDCNVDLFSMGCGLDQADWKFAAVVQDPGVAGYPFAFVLQTLTGVGADAIADLGAAAVGADYFALGWIEFGTGLTWQQRAILKSAAPVAGVLTLTLDRDPDPYPLIGDDVVLFPGCDLQFATCGKKYRNKANFMGQPFVPLSNPSLVQQNQTAGSGGGKK